MIDALVAVCGLPFASPEASPNVRLDTIVFSEKNLFVRKTETKSELKNKFQIK